MILVSLAFVAGQLRSEQEAKNLEELTDEVGSTLRRDNRTSISVDASVSVPCFDFGASISTANQFADMERFMLDNDVEIVQFNYSLGDRLAAERLLPTAADRGLAVMINVPFGGRRSSILDVVQGRALPDFAAEFDATTWPQFFLKYIISHPAVTCAIPGTRRVAYVDDNFGAAFGRLPDAALRRRQEEFFDSIS